MLLQPVCLEGGRRVLPVVSPGVDSCKVYALQVVNLSRQTVFAAATMFAGLGFSCR